jgi:hypothetical protein
MTVWPTTSLRRFQRFSLAGYHVSNAPSERLRPRPFPTGPRALRAFVTSLPWLLASGEELALAEEATFGFHDVGSVRRASSSRSRLCVTVTTRFIGKALTADDSSRSQKSLRRWTTGMTADSSQQGLQARLREEVKLGAAARGEGGFVLTP